MDRLDFYKGKCVLVTGHTGFKGAWLCAWLKKLGAQVCGYSLPNDINSQTLRDRVNEFVPSMIFHMAAQALVLKGYSDPMWTVQTNVVGTIAVIEAARRSGARLVVITSDKVYRESAVPHKETDPLGGNCPYSLSKAAADLCAQAFPEVAIARAGNCVGHGDGNAGRLVPELMERESVYIRNPDQTRPWQHVLDALSGYLILGQSQQCGPFNFGPDQSHSVREVVEEVQRRVPVNVVFGNGTGTETSTLAVDSSKAKRILGWRPQWSMQKAVEMTARGYAGETMDKQIDDYVSSWH